MSPLSFLTAAGPGALLARRPAGVAHAYVGPLTPSGRFIPRHGRAVCKAVTRRLRVVLDPRSVDGESLCKRCSACLDLGKAGQVEPRTRDEWRKAYTDLAPFDVAYRSYAAETVEEVEQLEHAALLVAPFPACKNTPVASCTGKATPPLDRHLSKARARVGGTHRDERAIARDEANRFIVRAQNKRERHDAWARKEERIRLLGITAATARH